MFKVRSAFGLRVKALNHSELQLTVLFGLSQYKVKQNLNTTRLNSIIFADSLSNPEFESKLSRTHIQLASA